MDIKTTGALIAELRKQNHMTQKELAAKLNVTDKAVSKWERGIGYPEVTTIPLLAKELGVSANELLLGRRADDTPKEDAVPTEKTADVNLSETVEYMAGVRQQRILHWNNIAFFSMTAAFLIAIFVCCLCNYVVDGRFDWSLYVVASVAAAWLMITPLLKFRKHRAVAAMGGLTISFLPLLLLIESLCPAKNWVFPFALPIAAISLASFWVVVLLFRCFRGKLLFYIAFVLFLFGTVDNVIIHNFVVSYFALPSTMMQNLPTVIVAASCGFAALIFLCIGIFRSKQAK